MKPIIVMVGPRMDTRGGISSVVNVLANSDLIEMYRLIFVNTYIDTNLLSKLSIFVYSCFALSLICVDNKVRIIHIHSASRGSFFRKAILIGIAKCFGKKVILHMHGGMFNIFYFKECGSLRKFFIRRILLSVDKLIVLSNNWENEFLKIGCKKGSIIILHNSVSTPVSLPNRIPTNNVNILFMGRLEKNKGVYDLLEVASRIIKLGLGTVRFCFCGDGQVGRFRKIVIDRGLEDVIDIPGWIVKKEKYYLNADIYVLPSYNEGFPMSLLEAASYGLPLVSTCVGGIPDIIDDGVNGFLVSPGDLEALVEKLAILIRNPPLRIAMGNAAFNMVLERFHINQVAKKLNVVYAELLN